MNIKYTCKRIVFLFTTAIATTCNAKIWNVGPNRTYTFPSMISALVTDGDIIEIDAAVYHDCASWNASNLTLRGIGGRPHIKNKVCSGKGIWNLNGINTTIENIEFSGATNPDQNGAGIRGVGGGFTVRNCYFHNNDNGVLASPVGTLVADQSNVLIEYCEFFQNGFGDGFSHNIYIGSFKNFTIQYCFVHSAKIGHEIKSRAHNNYILYNNIADEFSDASRSIDLPNGGTAIIIGNVIEQGPNTNNSNLIAYGIEGLSNPAPHNLYLINNTVVNNRSNGSFVHIQNGTGLLKLVNNIFAGTGTVINGTAGTLDSAKNIIRTTISSVGFKDPSNFNYELTASSPAINNGTNPGTSGALVFTPVAEYVHLANKRDRLIDGAIDIGSFEYKSSTLSLIEEKSKENLSHFFPNPFNDSFTLRLSQAAERVIVTDIYGKIVETVSGLPADKSLKIGEALDKGTYIISIYFSSYKLETSRIVKIK